jgi:hypothetical protein
VCRLQRLHALHDALYTMHSCVAFRGPKTATDAGDANRKPYSLEGYNDWRTDWVGSEEALDYNAGFTMALAAAIELPKAFWTTPWEGAASGALDPECIQHVCVGLRRYFPRGATSIYA